MELKNQKFKLLYEISRITSSSLDIATILNNVLNLLTERLGVEKATITILDKETEILTIIAAIHLDEEKQKKGFYKLGEGITGTVAKTGKPMIIPKISEEPRFLNKTQTRSSKEDISFICTPIKIGDEILGTFSVDRLFDKNIALEKDLDLITVITSLIADKIKVLESINVEKRKLLLENAQLKNQLKEHFSFSNIIGKSSKMREVYEQIQQVAKTNSTVLIRGESGTGKELVASAIHYSSLRSEKPYIKVNCSALPPDLIESELFGHEKGAFTDAMFQKEGRFFLANKGTLFLDEIGEISPMLQVKFLRVLQEKEFERVGGIKTIKSDVRIIVATNRNLEEAVQSGAIRQDFYYRINVFTINLPPLRERKSDIMLLADFFLEKFARENNKHVNRISTPAIDMLMSYHWPGNVRELENCIERAVILCKDNVIRGNDLPPSLQMPSEGNFREQTELSLEDRVERYEKELILEALKNSRGNVLRASKKLNTTNRILGYKIKNYKIEPKTFK